MDPFAISLSDYVSLDYGTYIVLYALFSVPAFFIFWVQFHSRFWIKRIQTVRRATSRRIRSEIKWSLCTFVIFTLVDVSVFYLVKAGHTQVYKHISDYGVPYLIFSVLLMLVIHDAFFYFTHRLMHWRPLFKRVHYIHHASVDPTPFTAFSFHPAEALIEAGLNYVLVFSMPTHILSLTLFQVIMTLMNVLGHMGYEFYPTGFTRSRLGRWFTTSTHHNMHHERFQGNYGLYFSYWDKIFGTEFKEYHRYFAGIKARRASKEDLKKAV